MPTTITSYTTFSPNTKARATEVNNNFSNHRGTLLPINSDTASASDSTHDLGSSSHRWKDIYADSLNLLGSTSTTNFKVVPNTSATNGSLDFMLGSTTIGGADINGFRRIGSSNHTDFYRFIGPTNTALYTSGSRNVATVTLTTYGGPVIIQAFGDGSVNTSGWLVRNTSGIANINLVVSGSTAGTCTIQSGSSQTAFAGSSVKFFHEISAGTHEFIVEQKPSNGGEGSWFGINLLAYELK